MPAIKQSIYFYLVHEFLKIKIAYYLMTCILKSKCPTILRRENF